MASVTKTNPGNEAMSDEASEDNEREQLPANAGGGGGGATTAVPRTGRGGGFFSIYKKGQGYWTRMGTALAAAFLALTFADFIYTQMNVNPYSRPPNADPLYIPKSISASVAIAVLFAILYFAWRMMNKPSHVDFLIATDSEMKKVNWTTRKELMGSTKVVIFFVLLISALLFALDVIFGYFFQLIKVLEFGPFQ